MCSQCPEGHRKNSDAAGLGADLSPSLSPPLSLRHFTILGSSHTGQPSFFVVFRSSVQQSAYLPTRIPTWPLHPERLVRCGDLRGATSQQSIFNIASANLR
ncbi:hypothetical protein QC761_0050690 [Podospora bellae-mahoneyi]|uniref:Uncharacterized protein n=1 Tax=Podospora bellae-mahoneyi TaxID=2093777 RepID=A0ABR0FMW0_9PEZI|nr:hypothetical protein QC761_0050690 [Podospora bellae-mahoneyi]